MPQLGESMAEATIVALKVQPGEQVTADQEIIEVETDKAVMGVTTPCAGEVAEIIAQVKQTYTVGAVLGYVEASVADAARFEKTPEEPAREPATATANKTQGPPAGNGQMRDSGQASPSGGLAVPALASGAGFSSPRLRARVSELGLTNADLAGIAGTGAGNRLTVRDLENFVDKTGETVAASALRVGVADAMRRSWSRPLATVGRSLRLDALLAHRRTRDPKPGPALYAVRALAVALAENPAPASRLFGSQVAEARAIDIGVAVEAQDGIMVPILRGADQLSLAELTSRYDELVGLARQRRLSAEMTSGGIASVTNFGTFGLEWGTPIPLPDQTMILGLGAGRKVPAWDEASSQFLPVTEAQLTLSFDHRSLDGGGAGRLLARVAELLANPEQL